MRPSRAVANATAPRDGGEVGAATLRGVAGSGARTCSYRPGVALIHPRPLHSGAGFLPRTTVLWHVAVPVALRTFRILLRRGV